MSKNMTSISDMIDGAMGPINGTGIALRRKRFAGTNTVSPEFSQSEIKHIDHYIDGITVPRRERKPFSPVAYMRGAA